MARDVAPVRARATPAAAGALSGYLNVLKPPAMTSHDVVARLRRLSGQRRVGHSGTLDPSAVGVLPIALGRATRTLGSPIWDRKLYWADICFGWSTDTDDAQGQVLATGRAERVELSAATAALHGLVGDISQRPPVYSAIHVGRGQRAYQQARRAVPDTRAMLVPPLGHRPVRVDAIAVTAWTSPVLSLIVQCRSGTYLRAMARDLGELVGCPAHLQALVRLRVGPFTLSDALDLRALDAVARVGVWDRVMWTIDCVAASDGALVGAPRRVDDIGHGRSWPVAAQTIPRAEKGPPPRFARVYSDGGQFLGFVQEKTGLWHPSRGPVARTSRAEVREDAGADFQWLAAGEPSHRGETIS